MPRHLRGRLLTAAAVLALAVPTAGCGSGGSGSADDALEIWIRQAPGSDADRTAQKPAAAYADGGDFLTDRGGGRYEPAVSSPATVEAVRWLRDQFCTAKTVNPGAVSDDTTVTHEVFEKGQGGIYLTGPYVLARFEKNIGPGKVEVVPVPKGPSGGPGTLGEGENARYSPPVPNWTPFRQAAADAFNALWADCSADVTAAMNRLAGTYAQELKNQNAAA